MVSILITTPIPSPYQVELFDALASAGDVELKVLYSFRGVATRSWRLPGINHDYGVVGELSHSDARDLMRDRDLVVFSGYASRRIRQLISERDASGKAWAFWGERPGTLMPRWLGRAYRSMVFPALRRPNVAIWGIGAWAVDAYRRELGKHRYITNVPYYSNLDRFFAIDRTAPAAYARKFVFSGSLIKRKGVDLLAAAFIELALEFPDAELHLIGEGPLEQEIRGATAMIADRVHFHGFRQWDELPAYYSKGDILCAPSRYDGWGLIVPEALAAGMLVVSTDRTGAAVELLDDSSGWIVKSGMKSALLAALREAASLPPEERVSRIVRGRSLAARQNIDAGVARVLEAIDGSLARWDEVMPPSAAVRSQPDLTIPG